MSDLIIPAKPTLYQGYHMRSRLEARWAFFFDTIGILWEYEPECFKFEDGTLYEPDFWLPRVQMFAEVKPVKLTSEEYRKAELLSIGSGAAVLLLVGAPNFSGYESVADGHSDSDYSLDIFDGQRYYWEENRFYSDPPEMTEKDFSLRYVEAIFRTRRHKFEDAIA